MESQDFTESQNYADSGPMTVSDLHHSVPNSSASKKRKFKRQKAHHNRENTADPSQQESTIQSTIEEPILNRLRSRLDPTYNNTASAPVMVDSDSLPESTTPAVDKSMSRLRKKKQRENSKEQGASDRPTEVDFTTSETQLANNTAQAPVQVVGRNDDDRMLLSSPLRQLPELDTGDIHQERVERFQPMRRYSDPDDPHLLVSQEDILQEVHNDIVDDAVPQDQPKIIDRPSTIFVEQKGKQGFTAYKRDDLTTGPLDNRKDSFLPSAIASTSQLCMYIHAIITKVSNFAHGLLAGISLWECIVVNLLAKEEPKQILLLQFYSMLSLPSHFVHLFLLTITIVNLCDRLDIVKLNKTCLDKFLRSPQHLTIILSLAVILIGYILTLSVVAIDERISLFLNAPNEWLDVLTTFNGTRSALSSTAFYIVDHNDTVYIPSGSTSSRLNSWLAINIVRAICYNTSWMLSVWLNSYNRLEERLTTV